MAGSSRSNNWGIVYNMEVEDLHCYSVGENGILVHNDNGIGTGANNTGVQPYETGTYGELRANLVRAINWIWIISRQMHQTLLVQRGSLAGR